MLKTTIETSSSTEAERHGVAAGTEAPAPSLLDYPATYLLIGLNVIVYLLMVRLAPPVHLTVPADAAGSIWRVVGARLAQLLTHPFGEQMLIHFGSCVPVRLLGADEWWRLVSSIFVHVTLLHLLLNMWCLWNLGIFGERLLGRPGLVAVYLLTGAAGMLLSVLLSVFTGQLQEITAGASGAVFGLAGMLIVLLSNRHLAAPWEELRSLRRQVVFFALANLILGGLPTLLPRIMPSLVHGLHLDADALPNIDSSAHLGGLVSGLALGLPLFPRMTSGRSTYRARQAIVFSSGALLLALVSYAVMTFARSR